MAIAILIASGSLGAAPALALAPGLGPVFAAEVQSNSAVLQGGVNPGGSRTTYLFEYGTDASFQETIVTPLRSAGSGSFEAPVSYKVTNLHPDSIYFFRLIAVNLSGEAIGTFDDGGAASFETELAPCESIACQLPPSLSDPSLATLAPGRGNPPLAFRRYCRKGYVKRRGKCVKRQMPRPHRAKHRRKGRA